MNELLFFVSIGISYGAILLLYKYFGKTSLFVWMGFAMVLANIEASKGVEMFGLAMTLGNVIYVSTDFITTIFNECHSKKEARQAVLYGFIASVMFVILSQITINFKPMEGSEEISNAMKMLFGFAPRVVASSLLTYLVSSYIDTGLYDFLKRRVFTKNTGKHLFLRSEVSSLVSQFVDSALFTILAFTGVAELGGTTIEGLAILTLTTYFAKVIIGAVDTPFIYIAKRINNKRNATNSKFNNL